MKSLKISLLVPLVALSTSLQAQEDSHVHGIAELNLVIDQNNLLIEFESPAANIVGFEHQAETEAEKKKIKAALATMKQADYLIELPANAGCLLTESEVELHSEHEEHGDDHAKHEEHDEHEEEHEEHDEDHEKHEAGHSEFHASYTFTCAETDALSQLPVTVFEQFPGIEEVHLQAITPWGQSGAEIEAKDALIRLK